MLRADPVARGDSRARGDRNVVGDDIPTPRGERNDVWSTKESIAHPQTSLGDSPRRAAHPHTSQTLLARAAEPTDAVESRYNGASRLHVGPTTPRHGCIDHDQLAEAVRRARTGHTAVVRPGAPLLALASQLETLCVATQFATPPGTVAPTLAGHGTDVAIQFSSQHFVLAEHDPRPLRSLNRDSVALLVDTIAQLGNAAVSDALPVLVDALCAAHELILHRDATYPYPQLHTDQPPTIGILTHAPVGTLVGPITLQRNATIALEIVIAFVCQIFPATATATLYPLIRLGATTRPVVVNTLLWTCLQIEKTTSPLLKPRSIQSLLTRAGHDTTLESVDSFDPNAAMNSILNEFQKLGLTPSSHSASTTRTHNNIYDTTNKNAAAATSPSLSRSSSSSSSAFVREPAALIPRLQRPLLYDKFIPLLTENMPAMVVRSLITYVDCVVSGNAAIITEGSALRVRDFLNLNGYFSQHANIFTLQWPKSVIDQYHRVAAKIYRYGDLDLCAVGFKMLLRERRVRQIIQGIAAIDSPEKLQREAAAAEGSVLNIEHSAKHQELMRVSGLCRAWADIYKDNLQDSLFVVRRLLDIRKNPYGYTGVWERLLQSPLRVMLFYVLERGEHDVVETYRHRSRSRRRSTSRTTNNTRHNESLDSIGRDSEDSSSCSGDEEYDSGALLIDRGVHRRYTPRIEELNEFLQLVRQLINSMPDEGVSVSNMLYGVNGEAPGQWGRNANQRMTNMKKKRTMKSMLSRCASAVKFVVLSALKFVLMMFVVSVFCSILWHHAPIEQAKKDVMLESTAEYLRINVFGPASLAYESVYERGTVLSHKGKEYLAHQWELASDNSRRERGKQESNDELIDSIEEGEIFVTSDENDILDHHPEEKLGGDDYPNAMEDDNFLYAKESGVGNDDIQRNDDENVDRKEANLQQGDSRSSRKLRTEPKYKPKVEPKEEPDSKISARALLAQYVIRLFDTIVFEIATAVHMVHQHGMRLISKLVHFCATSLSPTWDFLVGKFRDHLNIVYNLISDTARAEL